MMPLGSFSSCLEALLSLMVLKGRSDGIIEIDFLIALLTLFTRTHDQIANFSHRTFLFRDVA